MKSFEEITKYLKKNQNTWLITGVAGFIGSNLLEALLKLNQKVVGIDNFDTGYQHNIDAAISDAATSLDQTLEKVGENFTFINGDIRILDDCKNACKNIDYVLHHAAIGSVPRSIQDPIYTNKANIDGFLNMIISANEAQVRMFVYAASSSTYGDSNDLPKIESKIGKPISPYAVTKLVNEVYADVFNTVYGFNSIGLRYFNIFGKRQDPNGAYAAVITQWIKSMLNNQSVFINGNGENSRDFCYIENVIQINILSALTENIESFNEVYNVAVNDRTSLNELHSLINTELVNRMPNIKTNKPIYRQPRIGDIMHSLADISKAKELLNYNPKFLIEDGLKETIKWYINND